MVTFALPTVPGESCIPTPADLLTNDISQSRLYLNAGPFEIRNVPAITSAGQIQLVTRDALGRQQVLTVPYYVAAVLLRPWRGRRVACHSDCVVNIRPDIFHKSSSLPAPITVSMPVQACRWRPLAISVSAMPWGWARRYLRAGCKTKGWLTICSVR